MNLRPPPSAVYDWAMAIASLWLSGGIMIDAWYHFHSTVETFFEPAHALLYAGLLAAYIVTGVAAFNGHRRGFAWRNALPAGYESTFAGLVVFLIGGVLDMIKHTLWGFEEAFNALLSPTHLLIGAGMFLIITGPVRSAFLRPTAPRSLVAQLPLLLSTASMMELVHWGTQFVFQSEVEHMDAPVPWYSTPHWSLTLLTLQYDKQGIGLLAVIVQSLLLVGFFMYIARRVRLSLGAACVLFVVGNAFIAAAQSNYLPQFLAVLVASVIAGIVADVFALSPRDEVTFRWHVAAFCVPAIYWTTMLVTLAVTMGGIWWSPDVISGSVVFAGLTGLAVSALAGPFGARTQTP